MLGRNEHSGVQRSLRFKEQEEEVSRSVFFFFLSFSLSDFILMSLIMIFKGSNYLPFRFRAQTTLLIPQGGCGRGAWGVCLFALNV